MKYKLFIAFDLTSHGPTTRILALNMTRSDTYYGDDDWTMDDRTFCFEADSCHAMWDYT